MLGSRWPFRRPFRKFRTERFANVPWPIAIASITRRIPASTSTASQRHSIFNTSIARCTTDPCSLTVNQCSLSRGTTFGHRSFAVLLPCPRTARRVLTVSYLPQWRRSVDFFFPRFRRLECSAFPSVDTQAFIAKTVHVFRTASQAIFQLAWTSAFAYGEITSRSTLDRRLIIHCNGTISPEPSTLNSTESFSSAGRKCRDISTVLSEAVRVSTVNPRR